MTSPAPTADDIPALERLGDDAWRCVMQHVPVDDQFAARLASTKMSRNASTASLPGFAAHVQTRTRVVSTLRSEALRAWAAETGSPSPFPHWVELHSLSRASYNGRVGRALGPPNESGRVAVLLDGGFGELEPVGIKPMALKPSNLHPLVCLETELVYAVRLKSGRNGPSNWCEVSVPRRHSCFAREQHSNSFSGYNPAFDSFEARVNAAEAVNSQTWEMAFKSQPELMQEHYSVIVPYMMTISDLTVGSSDGPREQSTPLQLLSRHTILTGETLSDANAEPLKGARYALVQRPPLLAACGENLALQRIWRPHSRGLMAMTNQPACFLMIDPTDGFAPPHDMDGIGDAYVYRANASGEAQHFRLHDFEHIWDFISGELGSGEVFSEGDAAEYLTPQIFTRSRQTFMQRFAA